MTSELLAIGLLVAFGIPTVLSDLKSRTISNFLSLGFSAGSLLLVLVSWASLGVAPAPALVSGLIAGIVFLVLYLAGRGSLGEADVKLAPGFGMIMGGLGGPSLLWWLLGTFLGAGVFAAIGLMLRRLTLKQSFAFAPFMFTAAFLVLIAPR